MKRPTIADIATRAGVTKAAVSFALNGQPGVSAATRERILAIAGELGFQRSSAARALSDGRAGAFGLVIDRPARTLSPLVDVGVGGYSDLGVGRDNGRPDDLPIAAGH